MLEEKFKVEIETARRSAEIESQLILERHLKANLEVEHRKTVELKEMEKKQLIEV